MTDVFHGRVKTLHGADGVVGEVNQCGGDKNAAGDGVEQS
jgi:hypothetical protein